MTSAHRQRRPIVKDHRSFLGKLRQLVKNIFVGLCAFAFLSAVILVALAYGSLRSFSQKKYPQRIVITSSVLDDNSNPFLIVYIDNAHQQLILLNLTDQLKISVLGGYGDYELRSVGPLLNLEKKPASFIRSAYALGLEQGLDDVILLDKVKVSAELNAKSILWQILTATELKSTLNLWQRWQLFCYAWRLPENKVKVSRVDTLESWQAWQKDQLQSVNPSCSLSVINTTSKVKLATKIGQILENSGVRVVRTATEGDQQPQTEIKFSPHARDCDYSLSQAVKLLPFTGLKPIPDDEADARYRSDVVVLIGSDLGNLVDPGATLQ